MENTKPSPLNLPSFSLKRKRPPQIQIPNILKEINANQLQFNPILTPKTTTNVVSIGGLGYGVSAIKGNKKFMEDTHKIVSCSDGDFSRGFFGVYDGHGGRKAAEFAAENLHENILEMMGSCGGDVSKEEAVKAGYLKTDREFLKQGLVSGTCCVTALIEGLEVVVSNLGDCRAVLCRGGRAEALTTDHRAEQEDERKRIEDKGGYVEIHRGAWRVHGILSVSRSIGDAHLKDWVLAEPDTKTLQLTPDMEFLVLASDGLWEEVGNQEAVDIVQGFCMPEKKSLSAEVCQKDESIDYAKVNISPSSKLRRISLVKQQKGPRQSPVRRNTVDNSKIMEDEFGCENDSPPSKTRRVSLVKRVSTKTESPIKVDNSKIMEDEFGCENDSPPSKTRRVSLVKRVSTKTESPIKENYGHEKKPASGVLVAACKELVNLAVSRGSLDDITVMIVDLNHFRCNS